MMIEIFGHNQCMYCKEAKKLCEMADLDHQYYDMMDDMSYHNELEKRIGKVKTVPQIFIDGEHVGGFTDLKEAMKNG